MPEANFPNPNEFKTDHDALITFIAEFRGFRDQITNDVKEIKDDSKVTLSDHEIRLRNLETMVVYKSDYSKSHSEVVHQVTILNRYLYLGLGALGVIQLVIGYILYHNGK